MLKHSLKWLAPLTKKALQLLLSALLWLTAIWFVTAGFAVLMHEGLSNWHATPHFVVGTTLSALAIRRLVVGFRNGGHWQNRARGISVAIALMFGFLYAFVGPDSLLLGRNNLGEFSEEVEGHDFDIGNWARSARIEDFADYATFWNSPGSFSAPEQRAQVLDYQSFDS